NLNWIVWDLQSAIRNPVGLMPALYRTRPLGVLCLLTNELLRKYKGWRAWLSLKTTSQFRHSSMECWNSGDMDVSGRIPRTRMPALHAGTSAPVRAPYQRDESPCRSMPRRPTWETAGNGARL
ncbi:MAG TPA: hypothetical protein VIE89_25720, partial [Candidatus Binatia bacterium]